MKMWRRIPFTVLALWAMLLTLLPQTVWACPMTGRIDVASRVCLGTMPVADGKMPCAHSGSKCCKPISVPPSPTDDNRSASHVFAAAYHSSVVPPAALPTPEAQLFVVFPVETFQAPALRVYVARFTGSPPSFWTQHRPISLVGRAPPVL